MRPAVRFANRAVRPTMLVRLRDALPTIRRPPVTQGPVAQRLEQGTHNPLVGGSNPSGPTTTAAPLVEPLSSASVWQARSPVGIKHKEQQR